MRTPSKSARRGPGPASVRTRFAALAATVPLALAGCSTSRLAVGAMGPVLENTVTVALRSDDTILVGDALPTSLLLIEGMVETDPGNRQVATLGAMLSFAYSFGWLESESPARASARYERGRELGWLALGRPEIETAVREGSFAELPAALSRIGEEDVEALLWVAANWGMWIQLNLADPGAVADFSRLLPLAERVAELDETLWWGMPRILLGALHAGRPTMLGGDPVKSKAQFDRAYELGGRNMHLAQVFFARSYCIQTFDEDAWTASLREVIDAPPGTLPEAELLNRIARLQAEALIARTEDIFE